MAAADRFELGVVDMACHSRVSATYDEKNPAMKKRQDLSMQKNEDGALCLSQLHSLIGAGAKACLGQGQHTQRCVFKSPCLTSQEKAAEQ